MSVSTSYQHDTINIRPPIIINHSIQINSCWTSRDVDFCAKSVTIIMLSITVIIIIITINLITLIIPSLSSSSLHLPHHHRHSMSIFYHWYLSPPVRFTFLGLIRIGSTPTRCCPTVILSWYMVYPSNKHLGRHPSTKIYMNMKRFTLIHSHINITSRIRHRHHLHLLHHHHQHHHTIITVTVICLLVVMLVATAFPVSPHPLAVPVSFLSRSVSPCPVLSF